MVFFSPLSSALLTKLFLKVYLIVFSDNFKKKKKWSVDRGMTIKAEVEKRYRGSIPYGRCKVWIERKVQGLNDKELL